LERRVSPVLITGEKRQRDVKSGAFAAKAGTQEYARLPAPSVLATFVAAGHGVLDRAQSSVVLFEGLREDGPTSG
jgi:hypothetical protein